MGCKNTSNFARAEEKITFYEKFIMKTRVTYMDNSPLTLSELENNPKAPFLLIFFKKILF